jgi:hypothetical protein
VVKNPSAPLPLFPGERKSFFYGIDLIRLKIKALIIVSANFPLQEGRARVFLEERQAV